MAYLVRHPFRNQTYRLLDDGTIEVEDLDSRTTGRFDRFGAALAGELRFADPHLLDWVGGRALMEGYRQRAAAAG